MRELVRLHSVSLEGQIVKISDFIVRRSTSHFLGSNVITQKQL